MDTAVRADDIADLSNLEAKRGILERLLHLTASKQSKVAALFMRGAVGMFRRKLCELVWGITNEILIRLQDFDRLGLRAHYVRFLPARRAPATAVLHQQVTGSDFVTDIVLGEITGTRELLYLLLCKASRRIPRRLLGVRIVEVGLAPRVGHSDLPSHGVILVVSEADAADVND